jgi:hypothetical protein
MGTPITSVVVFGVWEDSFHETQIDDGLYKLEVCGLKLLDAPLPFTNHKDTHYNYSYSASSRPIHIVEQCNGAKN